MTQSRESVWMDIRLFISFPKSMSLSNLLRVFDYHRHCVLSGKGSESKSEACSVLSATQRTLLVCGATALIGLSVTLIFICRRNRKWAFLIYIWRRETSRVKKKLEKEASLVTAFKTFEGSTSKLDVV